MMDLLANLITWQFGVGFVLGLVGQRLLAIWRARHADKHNPLPGGRRRQPSGLSRLWVVGGICVLVQLLIVVNVESTAAEQKRQAQETTRFAAEVRECQRQFFETLKYRSQITSDNDRLSLMQREALADWLHDLIFPPTDIAALDQEDPRRMSWVLVRTAEADRVIRQAQDEQHANDAERRAHPYPEPTCGK